MLSIVCHSRECRPLVGAILHSCPMEDKTLAKQFGAVVRRLRRERGISQEAFASLCGLHRTYMGSVERGEKTVTIMTASKIANALDVPLSQLFLQIEIEWETTETG